MNKIYDRFRELLDVLSGEADENYTIQTAIVGTDLTVSLKNLAGADASPISPIFSRGVDNRLMKITSALSVAIIAAMGDIFGWDAGKIQGNDAQLFVYRINNNGTPQIGVSPCPTLSTVATNYYDAGGLQVGAAGHTNMVMSGIRNPINTCSVIGRVNVLQNDDNTWAAPTTSKVINRAIYETDLLTWTAIPTGFGTLPAGMVSMYRVRGNRCNATHREPNAGISNATTFTVSAPITAITIAGMAWTTILVTVTDGGNATNAFGHATMLSAGSIFTFQKTPGLSTSWTGTATSKAGSFSNLEYEVS